MAKGYVTTRNWVAVAAHQRRAATHGGTPRQNHKRGRKATKQELKQWKRS